MNKILNNTISTLLLICIYRILSDYVYINLTNAYWEYSGFVNNETKISFIVSWLFLILISFSVLPFFKSKDGFYPDLIILIFTMRVVPFTTIIRFLNVPSQLIILYFLFFLQVFLLTKIVKVHSINLSRDSIFGNNNFLLYLILSFFFIIIVYISWRYTGFRLHSSFFDVYDMRIEAREFDMPTLLKYVWAPATNVLPLLFVYFMQEKKKVLCWIIIGVVILNFSINGMKSTMFKLIICILFCSIKIRDYKRYYLPILIILLLLTILEIHIGNHRFIHDLVVRRLLLIPSLLDTYYYDYILQNGPVYYVREGTLVKFIIGALYFGDPESGCNNGLFSDAYMNLGVLGCFLYPMVYAFLFRICSSAFRGADKGLIVFAAILMSYTIEGSELTTSFLTHGLFVFCIILYYISLSHYKKRVQLKPKNLQIDSSCIAKPMMSRDNIV